MDKKIASKNIYIIFGKLSQEVAIRNIDIHLIKTDRIHDCVYIYIHTVKVSIDKETLFEEKHWNGSVVQPTGCLIINIGCNFILLKIDK